MHKTYSVYINSDVLTSAMLTLPIYMGKLMIHLVTKLLASHMFKYQGAIRVCLVHILVPWYWYFGSDMPVL